MICLNIALICNNIIRIAQIVGDYYESQGHNVYHFLLTNSRRLDYPVRGNIVYIRTEEKILNTDIYSFASSCISISKELRRLKLKYEIDTAISFMERYNILNVLSKKNEKCIVSVRTTLSLRNEFQGYEYNKFILRILYSLSDVIVTAGKYSKEDLIKNYHINKNKVVGIANPAIQYTPCSNKKWEYGNKVVISVTRFDPVKQVEHIIRAFSYLNSKDNETKLVLIGDGKEKNYLKKLVNDYNIQNSVLFLGYSEDVGYYLKHSKIFVMSSRVEGFPNAMVEAMACGLPIVSTDTPGSCEEIIGKPQNIHEEIKFCEYGILTPYMPIRSSSRNRALSKEEQILGMAMETVMNDDNIYRDYANRSLMRAKKYEYGEIMKEWKRLIV